MNINHLSYLMHVYETGSINKAASNLYLSQSNLSGIIKSIESEIGYSLFRRTNKGVVPTQEGRLFIQHVAKILKEYSQIQSVPSRIMTDESIHLSCSPSSCIADLYFSFCSSRPCRKGQDHYREVVIMECLEDIMRYRSHLAIFYTSSSQRKKYLTVAEQYQIQTITLLEHVPAFCMMHSSHALAHEDSVDLLKVTKYPFVTYEGVSQSDILEVCGLNDHSNILYVNSRSLFTDAIIYSGYLAPTLNLTPQTKKKLNCVCKPIKNYNDDMVIIACIPHGYILNSREKLFIDYLSENLKELLYH